MKNWTVRFATLYAFNLVVLLLIGALTPGVRVGWGALWASVILTAGAIWVKPLIQKWFANMAARSSSRRTKAGETLVQIGLVYLVELVLWILVVWLSGVTVYNWLFGYLVPPVFLLIAWAIYAAIDDRLHERASGLYDRASAKVGRSTDAVSPAASPASAVPGIPAAPAAPSASATPAKPGAPAKPDMYDGLTPEQRRMLDELGNG
jgi:hypothetical protein